LIDALTGNHIWAERYDHDLKDLFALQDEITTKILRAVRVELTEGESALSVEKYYRGKQGLDCYLKIMEGSKYQELFTFEGNEKARRIAEEAVAMCPEVPRAYQLLATVNTNEYFLGSSKSPQESIAKAFELAQKSLAMDDTQPGIHAYLSVLYCLKREYDKAIAEAERGVELAPSAPGVHYLYGAALINVGRPQEAIAELQKAIRFNPHCKAEYYWNLGFAYLLAGRYEEAISAYKKALQRSPNSNIPHVWLAITYSMMGREKEARAEAAEVLRINPKWSIEAFKKIVVYKDQSVTDTYCDALRKAGLK
jgi:adenylate cyclase